MFQPTSTPRHPALLVCALGMVIGAGGIVAACSPTVSSLGAAGDAARPPGDAAGTVDAVGSGGVGGSTAPAGAGGAASAGGAGGASSEALCLSTGGRVVAATCCQDVSDFPSTCLVGACGCAPAQSHAVESCSCPAGDCFDPTRGCLAPMP